MSASLVGSEMCIRDRPHSTEAYWGSFRATIKPARYSVRSVRFPSSSVPSVSYTHLTLPTICSV
eukprot:9654199-Alexandrium_andersonii.AAC.1